MRYALFDDTGESEEHLRASGGLFYLLGIIGSDQGPAVALTLLLEHGDSLVGRLILFDAFKMQWRSLTVPKDPLCPICTGITPTEGPKIPEISHRHLPLREQREQPKRSVAGM